MATQKQNWKTGESKLTRNVRHKAQPFSISLWSQIVL